MRGQHTTLIRRYFPEYQSPKRAYEEQLDVAVSPGAVWLDLGCGRQLTSNAVLDQTLTRRAGLAVGCDRDPHLGRHSTIRNLVLCDAAALPFRDEAFDLVTSAMVMEHIASPEAVFAEVARVAKPRASFIVFTPNKLNYAMLVARITPHRFHLWYKRVAFFLNRRQWQTFEDDVFPTWYRANTVRRLRRLMRGAGLEERRIARLSMAHSFGFVRPLFILSLLFERFIQRPPLDALKADLLAVFTKPAVAGQAAVVLKRAPRRAERLAAAPEPALAAAGESIRAAS